LFVTEALKSRHCFDNRVHALATMPKTPIDKIVKLPLINSCAFPSKTTSSGNYFFVFLMLLA
jgi:hypothetical protein